MKRILLGFIFGLMVNPFLRTMAQETPEQANQKVIQEMSRPGTLTAAATWGIVHSSIVIEPSLTLRDCVETMADFSVYHRMPSIFEQQAYGVTDLSSRSIYIFDNYSLDLRRKTAIHELWHVRFALLGQAADEKEIGHREETTYRELFGQ